MRRHREVIVHLTLDEIEKRYRDCRDGRTKSWWHAIWLRMQGKSTSEVAKLISCKPDWVRRLIRRWNAEGTSSIIDKRKFNGRDALLSLEQKCELMHALMEPAPDGGLWNSRKVADWISQRVERPVPKKRGWIYLRQLGLTTQTPRPRHNEASQEEQDAFKKNFPNFIKMSKPYVRKQKSMYGPKMKLDSDSCQ